MHLTLLVFGLLLPEAILEPTVYDLHAPALSKLLGRGRRRTLPDDALAHLFGLDSLPAAALRRLGAGKAAPDEWLCLDPVRWQVGARGVTLDDPARLALNEEESAALLEAVQPLFADWGELSASAPGHWELHLTRPLSLQTVPLPAAIHQPIDPDLPGGNDGLTWRRRIAEAQTILFAHPVNRRREEANLPTANSLWPWGQGRLPESPPTGFSAVCSDDPVVIGLCRHAGIARRQVPERFDPGEGNILVTLDSLAHPARSLDALRWREALTRLERDWLAPALEYCAELIVIGTRLTQAPAAVAYEWRRRDHWRLWRSLPALTELK
ncbi:hypothetical protein [Sulfuricystis multivorans]|uniref:hypothetical protein n=1 Tax=Sulfuricystis multivorans TaxID=2211108 RepID=UPI000F822EEE|nr:hypothetical protein [Sulfuricystis multivorans]